MANWSARSSRSWSGAEPGSRHLRVIGSTLGPLCPVGRWLAPMYGAGFLESRNIVEYIAARLRREAVTPNWSNCLLEMAEVEWEHEYFRERVESHAFARFIPMWKLPPPKSEIQHPRGCGRLILSEPC